MRRRTVWLSLGAAVVLGAGGFVAYQLNRTDRTTTARTVDQALDEFREGTDTEVPAGSSSVPDASIRLPSPGVYVYRTTGSDGVDALGGAEHTYPATTTITVSASGCGVTKRWDVAVERWEEVSVCASEHGAVQTRFVSYHRFFGSGDTDDERCAGEPRPAGAEPGATWTFTCTIENDSATPWEGRVIGSEPIDVGRTTVTTDHVMLVTVDDPDGDDMRIDTWFAEGTDLVVREIGERHTTDPSPIGDVHYREHYEIVLTSLEPMR